MHIVPALHGSQISGLKPRAVAYIRQAACDYLVSSTMLSEGVPASLLMAETRWPGVTLNT